MVHAGRACISNTDRGGISHYTGTNYIQVDYSLNTNFSNHIVSCSFQGARDYHVTMVSWVSCQDKAEKSAVSTQHTMKSQLFSDLKGISGEDLQLYSQVPFP